MLAETHSATRIPVSEIENEKDEAKGKRRQSLGGLKVLMARTRRQESSGDQTELTGSDEVRAARWYLLS
jgi:hypothetical protein